MTQESPQKNNKKSLCVLNDTETPVKENVIILTNYHMCYLVVYKPMRLPVKPPATSVVRMSAE